MAYTAPPTFSDDTVLAATDLNKLSTNQEYFKGVVDAPNVVFSALHCDGSNVEKNYFFEHTHRYIHWYGYLNSADVSKFAIYIYSESGTLQFTCISDTSSPATQAAALTAGWRSYYDASALTLGTTYRALVEIDAGDGSADAYLLYLEERPTT